MTEQEFAAIRKANPEAYFTLQIWSESHWHGPTWLDYCSIKPDDTTQEVVRTYHRLNADGKARLVKQSYIPNCPLVIMGDTSEA